MSNPSDWMQLFSNNFTNINPIEIPQSTITTTDVVVATTTGAATTSRNDHDLTPNQGRVSKPVRKRSRASRRTPTTLFNTDTTNFRAMVQQFTGGPSSTSTARPQLPVTLGTFRVTQHVASTAATMAPTTGRFQVQYPNQMQQQHMFMLSSNMHGGGGSGGVSSHAPPGTSPTNENRNYDNYMR
ncbi:VQ motif-containing protein 22 [Sesamum indicum]|uniref:VQ motif-containing protein 22 n=1 Tax=Sesamum indicum TaxID=4182 RepID=A0A6I9TMH3_SESIN|nr:VQ motif-containing protein 22 [Sesamum indicum]